MRHFLYAAVLLAAVLLVAEVGLTLLSQWGMEKALSAQYGLPPNTKVRINSFPFLVSVVRNHLGEVRFSWDGVLACENNADELRIAYEGEAILRDVELRMISIIRGKLEIESIYSVKVTVSMDVEDMDALFFEDGQDKESDVEAASGGSNAGEFEYQVKVLDDNHICFYRPESSTLNQDGGHEDEEGVEDVGICVGIQGLPLNAFLKTSSLEGEKLVLNLGIPGWQGYVDPSINN